MSAPHPLARQFFALAESSGFTLNQIACMSGVGRRTFTDWRDKHSPNVVSLEAALNTIGYRLDIAPVKIDHEAAE